MMKAALITSTMKLLIRSFVFGMLAAIGLGVLTICTGTFFDVYIAPLGLFTPILDRIPLTVVNEVDRLLPIAGPAAGVGFIFAGALCFWTIIFGALYFIFVTLRRRQSTERAIVKSR